MVMGECLANSSLPVDSNVKFAAYHHYYYIISTRA